MFRERPRACRLKVRMRHNGEVTVVLAPPAHLLTYRMMKELELANSRIDRLEAILQEICIKCRSNEWGPETPRKEILNWVHDKAATALANVDQ